MTLVSMVLSDSSSGSEARFKVAAMVSFAVIYTVFLMALLYQTAVVTGSDTVDPTLHLSKIYNE